MSVTGTPGVGTVMLAIPSKKVRYYTPLFFVFFPSLLPRRGDSSFVCLFVCLRARAGKRIGKAPSMTDTDARLFLPLLFTRSLARVAIRNI